MNAVRGWAMRTLYFSGSILAALLGLESYAPSSKDALPAPQKRQISSALQRNAQETLIVAVDSSGGGAGDITHRVLVCKSGSKMCELLASIDTNDAAAPVLSKTREGVQLTINKSDYVAGFRNFSRELGSLQPGELYLQYREKPGQLPILQR